MSHWYHSFFAKKSTLQSSHQPSSLFVPACGKEVFTRRGAKTEVAQGRLYPDKADISVISKTRSWRLLFSRKKNSSLPSYVLVSEYIKQAWYVSVKRINCTRFALLASKRWILNTVFFRANWAALFSHNSKKHPQALLCCYLFRIWLRQNCISVVMTSGVLRIHLNNEVFQSVLK